MPKVGDIVRVDFVISHINKDGSIAVIRPRYNREKDVLSWATQHIASFFDNEPGVEIVKGPWVPAVGDVVVPLCVGHKTYDYTIKAIVEDKAWVSWFNSKGEENGFVVLLKYYKLKETSS